MTNLVTNALKYSPAGAPVAVRASDQIDPKTRSVGLGLYIVDAIVRAHGGTVGVMSTAEAGTTFTVRLPKEPGGLLPG